MFIYDILHKQSSKLTLTNSCYWSLLLWNHLDQVSHMIGPVNIAVAFTTTLEVCCCCCFSFFPQQKLTFRTITVILLSKGLALTGKRATHSFSPIITSPQVNLSLQRWKASRYWNNPVWWLLSIFFNYYYYFNWDWYSQKYLRLTVLEITSCIT